MSFSYLILLSGIQGVTEFLPVSSSGHLVMVADLLKIEGRSLTFDVAMHVGTLGAVIVYLWRDIAKMVYGIFLFSIGKKTFGGRLFLMILIGSVPISLVGYVLNYFLPQGIADIRVVAWMTIIFGIFLVITDKIGMTVRRIEHLKFIDIFFIGVIQVFALIPGTSRSGVCMSVARILGMERSAAARFSMLLGMPAIAGAGGLKAYELWEISDVAFTRDIYLAVGLSFVFALLSIWVMMAWLRRANFTPFAIYRVALGAVILATYYGFIG